MNFTFLPSLEHIALVKIATILWNQNDIRALIRKFQFDDAWSKDICGIDWIILENIEKKIKEKVLLLNKPRSLKEKILCVIKPIGLQIYRWMKCNKKSYKLSVNLPDEFSWTPHGTIDKKKTAEALMADETIRIKERYKLACIYCLENHVRALWEKMPENCRAFFHRAYDPRIVAQHDLVVIWTYDIKGEMAKLENIIRWHNISGREVTETCTPEQYPLKCAFIHRNKVAAEYFWSKLSLEDREDSFRFMLNQTSTWMHGLYLAEFPEIFSADDFDILRFVFRHGNRDQQIELFEKYQRWLLPCLLQWPWQSLFMDMTNHVVLTNSDYYNLLYEIARKVFKGYKDYDYQGLFGEFWRKSTEEHKKYVIGRLCDGYSLLFFLFQNKDKKNISLILKDASVLEKVAMCDNISWRVFAYSCDSKKLLIEFDMLDFFVNELISSHEILIKIKDKCMKEYPWYDDRLEKIFENLNEKFKEKCRRKSSSETS